MQKRDEVTGMSNMSNFKEICEKLSSQDPTIDRVYWSARAAVALPQAIDMIESLRSLLIEMERSEIEKMVSARSEEHTSELQSQ